MSDDSTSTITISGDPSSIQSLFGNLVNDRYENKPTEDDSATINLELRHNSISNALRSEIASLPGPGTVKVGDIISIPVAIFDTREPVTDKPFQKVLEGIERYLPRKNIRWRHLDYIKDPKNILGEVGTTFSATAEQIDEEGKPYKQIIGYVEIEVLSPEYIPRVEQILAVQAKGGTFGTSLGWVEDEDMFRPTELTITPYAKCGNCVSVGQGTLISAAAECNSSECKCKKGETMSDDNPTEPKMEDTVQLHVEISQLKSQVAEKDKAIGDAQTEFDKQLAAKEAEKKAEVSQLAAKVAELKTELNEIKTLPIRENLVKNVMGLEGEPAEKRIASLASKSAEDLKEYSEDIELAATTAAKGATATPAQPIVGEGAVATPPLQSGTAEEGSDEDYKAYLKEYKLDYLIVEEK